MQYALPEPKPLTTAELYDMYLRYAHNAEVARLIEEAIRRRLRDEANKPLRP